MEQWFKIGEVANLYHIGTDTIRYYEERRLLNPRRSEAGYRLYGPKDICRLNMIRDLRRLNFSTQQICETLTDRTLDSTIWTLTEQRKAIKRSIEELQHLLNNVEDRLDELTNAKARPLGEIMLQQLAERRCYMIAEEYVTATDADMILIRRLINFDPEHLYIIGNNQIGSLIELQHALNSQRICYDGVLVLCRQGDCTLPAGDWLTVCYKGSYSQIRNYAAKLVEFADAHRLTPCGKLIELPWVDQHTTTQTEEFITELQLPVRKA